MFKFFLNNIKVTHIQTERTMWKFSRNIFLSTFLELVEIWCVARRASTTLRTAAINCREITGKADSWSAAINKTHNHQNFLKEVSYTCDFADFISHLKIHSVPVT